MKAAEERTLAGIRAELNRASTVSAATAWPASCQAVSTACVRAGANVG